MNNQISSIKEYLTKIQLNNFKYIIEKLITEYEKWCEDNTTEIFFKHCG